jgi:hypothetical protein
VPGGPTNETLLGAAPVKAPFVPEELDSSSCSGSEAQSTGTKDDTRGLLAWMVKISSFASAGLSHHQDIGLERAALRTSSKIRPAVGSGR